METKPPCRKESRLLPNLKDGGKTAAPNPTTIPSSSAKTDKSWKSDLPVRHVFSFSASKSRRVRDSSSRDEREAGPQRSLSACRFGNRTSEVARSRVGVKRVAVFPCARHTQDHLESPSSLFPPANESTCNPRNCRTGSQLQPRVCRPPGRAHVQQMH